MTDLTENRIHATRPPAPDDFTQAIQSLGVFPNGYNPQTDLIRAVAAERLFTLAIIDKYIAQLKGAPVFTKFMQALRKEIARESE